MVRIRIQGRQTSYHCPNGLVLSKRVGRWHRIDPLPGIARSPSRSSNRSVVDALFSEWNRWIKDQRDWRESRWS